jgi:hypothetical protein
MLNFLPRMGWCAWAGQNKIIVDRSCKVSGVLFAVRGVVVDSLFGLGLPLGSRYYVIHLRSKRQIGLCLLARVLFETARLGLTPSCS